MAHFQVSATPEPDDVIGWSFVGSTTDVVSLGIGFRLSLFFTDPDLLERLAETALEAARDLRAGRVAA